MLKHNVLEISGDTLEVVHTIVVLQRFLNRLRMLRVILDSESIFGDAEIKVAYISVVSVSNWNAAHRELVNTSETYLNLSLRTLLKKVYGCFPRILGKGDYASRGWQPFLRNRYLINLLSDTSAPSAQFNSLIIDASSLIAPITPLLTQLTYEGSSTSLLVQKLS
ncbi:hypothetical protein CY34DRAFT_752198 [Suillus luteus UH-Slu-Lm8-n1]|uniref:Uncharacterized protein n=1 Tax=Suillus luteus UH-Slu-Lm8-n1 TaxID=930992 RepID=A0A0C9Z5R0_9AGAM|nr:hypothetical protein CY34DRAFT_752198 [Suillus luteus UH-Slu-Lm8-n1]